MSTLNLIRAYERNYLEPISTSFRRPGTEFPWSVTPNEGRFLYEAARLVGSASSAYEVATAFGYSSLWIAAGLNGGLVSLDSYIEEMSNDQTPGDHVNPSPGGFEFAKAGAEFCGLKNVQYVIGSSPVNVHEVLMSVGYHSLNFVFIDGHHLNGQPLKDWLAIRPFMEEDGIVLLHDTHLGDVKDALKAVEEFFGKPHYHPALTGYNLVAVTGSDKIREELERASGRCREFSGLHSQ